MKKESPFWQKVLLLFIGAILTIVLSSSVSSYIANKTTHDTILNSAASVDYVDTKVLEVKTYSDDKDILLKTEIDLKASKEKVDLIYDMVKETHDYLIKNKK